MLNLSHRFAHALMDYAEENDLRQVYRQALAYVSQPGNKLPPEPLGAFLAHVPENNVNEVLNQFIDMAHGKMDLMDTRIISAVPLTEEQLNRLKKKLDGIFHKQMIITTTVDPSLLGGLRVIAGNLVLDDSIKRKLLDMKKSIYKGVYFKT